MYGGKEEIWRRRAVEVSSVSLERENPVKGDRFNDASGHQLGRSEQWEPCTRETAWRTTSSRGWTRRAPGSTGCTGLSGDDASGTDADITHYLTDDELYRTLAFPADYDWSTTVIFKFDVGCPEIWPKLCRFIDLCPEVKFGGWARTKVSYVHLIKTWTVDEADFLIGKREVDIEGIHCRILPVRVVPV
ncbi:hypothetical protein HPB51_011846 [Rhipicephalus microplus]|uniref:Uncharacterized protein n=1 Tax=Rhipicephalus microplus TaxID=6941 RepID=A0A9J6E8Z5_RHIMP|nr:hypothetical protein HPB51_011846 [Rhipicephalus microplus]